MTWWDRIAAKARGEFGLAPQPRQSVDGAGAPAVNLRPGSAELDWFVAQTELAAGRDLLTGARHLARLLMFDPGYAEWTALLEGYIRAASPDAERLWPRGDKFADDIEAVHAYLQFRRGQLADAVKLLCAVTQARPAACYLEAWALTWLEPPGQVEALSEELGRRLFGVVLARFPEARRSTVTHLDAVARWSRLCERSLGLRQDPGIPLALRAGLMRKAGLYRSAREIIKPFADRQPDFHSWTALAFIYREEGRPADAEEAFKQALRYRPADLGPLLEIADMHCDNEDYESALNWYQHALAKDRKQPWASASIAYCRFLLDKDDRRMDNLLDMARDGNPRARELREKFFRGKLPEPADIMADELRQLRKQILNNRRKAPVGEAVVRLANLEAPSNHLAFRLEMEALNHDLTLAVDVQRVPRPDPRQPLLPCRYLLWKYDGTRPRPGLPKPPREVSHAIAAIARRPFDEGIYWAAASRVASTLGPERLEQILAVMVHPPEVDSELPALKWLPRVQLVAAQVAGQVDHGWVGSMRREALLSVLHGPQDWATEAAIRVMARIGRDNEAFCPDIHEAFLLRADNRPDRGHCSWESTLLTQWATLPHLWPEERKRLKQSLQALHRDDDRWR